MRTIPQILAALYPRASVKGVCRTGYPDSETRLSYASRVVRGAPVTSTTLKPLRKALSGAAGSEPGSAVIFTSGFISRSVAALASATLWGSTDLGKWGRSLACTSTVMRRAC